MAFSRRFDSGWELTLRQVDGQVVARLSQGSKVFELISFDTTMLKLEKFGYDVSVGFDQNGEPWVTWHSLDNGPRYVWVCPYNTAMWTKNVMDDSLN